MRRVMVADPSKRLTIQEIQQHPWFLKDLPAGSLDYNDWATSAPTPAMQSAEAVDAVINAALQAAKKEKEVNMGSYNLDDDLLGSMGESTY